MLKVMMVKKNENLCQYNVNDVFKSVETLREFGNFGCKRLGVMGMCGYDQDVSS